MAFSRYARDGLSASGEGLTLTRAVPFIRRAIKSGRITPQQTFTVTQADRLDTIAGEVYGDSRYWWVLAAASDIGWGLQVPPGTIINVIDLQTVERFIT